jgi:acetyl esterase/lipase
MTLLVGLTFATMLAIRDAGLPMPGGIVGLSPWLDLLHSMPSVLTNAYSDYLPAEGFTQGGQGSLKNVAKLASTVDPDDDILKHPDMPEVQYYASNAVLSCPYVSPLVEKSLEGACPMLVVSTTVLRYPVCNCMELTPKCCALVIR